MTLHKSVPGKPLNSIPEGLWEKDNIPCPPASKEDPTVFFTRIRREEKNAYWQEVHKINKNEYLNAKTCPIKGAGGVQGLICETRLMEI